MPFSFTTRRRAPRTYETSTTHRHGFWHMHRKNPNRRAGGLKAALANPNTTHHGRERAKAELHHMGRGSEAHVPISTKIKRALGIRSTPRTTTRRRRYAY